MTFGAHALALIVAVLIFGVEAWRTRSLIALGLCALALAFLIS